MYVLDPNGFIYTVYKHTGLHGIKLPYGPIKPDCILQLIYLKTFQLLTLYIFLSNSRMSNPSTSNSVHCTELWTCFRPRWTVGHERIFRFLEIETPLRPEQQLLNTSIIEWVMNQKLSGSRDLFKNLSKHVYRSMKGKKKSSQPIFGPRVEPGNSRKQSSNVNHSIIRSQQTDKVF